MKIIDLTGQKLGRLTVLRLTGHSRGGSKEWECICDCGNKCTVTTRHLNRKKFVVRSCGCLANELRHRKGENHPDWKGYGEISQSYWTQRIFHSMVGDSNRKKLEIDIDKEYAWNLFIKQNRKCALSGLDIFLPTKWNDSLWTASLDRIDSSKGYIKGNVQWVHKHINIMKNKYKQDYFIDLCKLVTKNQTIK